MKCTIILVALLSIARAAPLLTSGSVTHPDKYIVMLNDGHTHDTFKPSFDQISQRYSKVGPTPQVHHKFENIPGFVAIVQNQDALRELLNRPEVDYIERDSRATVMTSQSNPPSWGQSRISEKELKLPAPYLYNSKAGAGVTVYVLDTGIRLSHSEFNDNRAVLGKNFITYENNTDLYGHGTHVASTIGGTLSGIAKLVRLVNVKVLDGTGKGDSSNIIAGMDWVIGDVKTKGKSIVNMSLGTGQSQAMNDAANRLLKAEIPVFAAAGNNETIDACTRSPAGTPDTFTVGASDIYDQFAYFSSFGPCINIIAPGVNIIGAGHNNDDELVLESGTSMATPHVAGAAALLLAEFNFNTVQELFDRSDTINLLLYNGGEV
ncbi:hypothetical protein BGZ82_011192 [Podila clonocystis]|nr:hypothetical protein BGZ82_011192 [Podila clonocystis]